MTTPSTPNPNPNGAWTVVSRRRGRKQSKKDPDASQIQTLTIGPPSSWTPTDSVTDPVRESKLLKKIESSLRRLESSRFYLRFHSQLRMPQIQDGLARVSASGSEIQMVVYGIGSIESYETPRLQLALALLLRRELGSMIGSVEVFDPILSSTECAVIEKLAFTVMSVDERGRREARGPTLFYMPHCEVSLYDNLLDANWSPSMLNRMVVLGNSFGEYERMTEIRGGGGSVAVEPAASRLIWARRYVREWEMGAIGVSGKREEEEEDGYFRAFHDMSLHFFNLDDDCDMNFS